MQNINSEAPLGKSDHTVLMIETVSKTTSTSQVEKLSYFKGDYDGMREELQKTNYQANQSRKHGRAAWKGSTRWLNLTSPRQAKATKEGNYG